ncbi:hypothetical protein KDI_26390 [Dictyobacter arantiisoli]|uniref:Uncharacterized protein n=1 Tax=Dictyobacter arantiisoli TaxID=2014874 RepID=A0A5A5TCZ9_9CHLR|nr:hypothetical protein KDI_26390 [Dictyobacter arantiisoli]
MIERDTEKSEGRDERHPYIWEFMYDTEQCSSRKNRVTKEERRKGGNE